MKTRTPRQLVEFIWKELGAGHLDVLETAATPGYVLHSLNLQQKLDRSDLRSILQTCFDNLEFVRVECQEVSAIRGGRVLMRFVVHAGAEGTGQHDFYGMAVHRVVGGLLVESWLLWDALRAEQELEPLWKAMNAAKEPESSSDQGLKPPANVWRWPPWQWPPRF